MTEDFNVKDAIYQLGLLLADPTTGLMQKALNTNWNEQYNKDFDLATTFDCFVDDVNRINTVLQLHDWLAENIEKLEELQEIDGDY